MKVKISNETHHLILESEAQNPKFRESVRRKWFIVVLPLRCFAVFLVTPKPQHCNTATQRMTPNA
jgi:hypothetical protein